MEDGLREQAGGTKNEETKEANGLAEDKTTTGTNGMGVVDGTTSLTETKKTISVDLQW